MEDLLAERFIIVKLAGISVNRLRCLEREGRIKPAIRTLGNMPLYRLGQTADIQQAA